MSEILISVEGLEKKFFRSGIGKGEGFVALSGVSFTIPRGSIFGLVGESGCGKTTLARCMLYLDQPSSGSVVFDGRALAEIAPREWRQLRHRMQIVFQDPNSALNPKLSVRMSLAEGLANRGITGSSRESRINRAADLVGIPVKHLGRKPGEFSGGQKQRIVIARSLVMDPDFLVLDEPVSNLDVSIQAQIVNLLMDLKNDLSLTYLFISHDLNLIAYLSDFVAVMYRGRIVEIAPTTELLANPLHIYTRSLFFSVKLDGPPVCPSSSSCTMSGSACIDNPLDLRDIGGGHFLACNLYRN